VVKMSFMISSVCPATKKKEGFSLYIHIEESHIKRLSSKEITLII